MGYCEELLVKRCILVVSMAEGEEVKLGVSRVWAGGVERMIVSVTSLLLLVTAMVDSEKNGRGYS